MNYLQLDHISAYVKARELCDVVWEQVVLWDWFSKQTIGSQLVRSADSISANIAEGFGRYHKLDKIKFYRYAFGSLKETEDWISKSHKRGLLKEHVYEKILLAQHELPREINILIKYTDTKLTI